MPKIKLLITGFISILPLLAMLCIFINKIWIWVLLEHFIMTMGLYVLITLYFSFSAIRNNNIKESNRILWFFGILAGNALAFPFYWYFYKLRPFVRKSK